MPSVVGTKPTVGEDFQMPLSRAVIAVSAHSTTCVASGSSARMAAFTDVSAPQLPSVRGVWPALLM